MTSNPQINKQPQNLVHTNPTFTYRASNVKMISNGTEQGATSSPSLWRKFQRRISHDHSKVPVAYVKPSRRYSLELDVLEDNEEEEEGEQEENEVIRSLPTSSNFLQDENSQNDAFNEDTNNSVNRLTANSLSVSLEAKDDRRKEKVSLDDNKIELTHDEILDQIRQKEPDEQSKDRKEEKQSRGRARKSKKTKQGYQRSMSAFAFFDMNDDEANNEEEEEEKETKKKEKGSKALSLKRHIIRKMSQTSLAFSGSPTEEVLPVFEERSENNLDNRLAIDDKESEVGDAASLDVFPNQVPSKQNKRIEYLQPSQRHSLPDLKDDVPEVDSSNDKPTFRVGTFDDSIQPAKRRPDSESSAIPNDDPDGPSHEKTFGSQPDISNKMSLSNSPGKTRRNGTVTKSISTPRSMTSTSLQPPPLTLTESRSLNALNEQGSMDGDNLSPRRKVAGTWDVDDFQPDEEEKKKKKWSSKLGGFARRFGGGASVLQHAVTHNDADGLQKLLQDANNRNEINNTKTTGVTVFHQACVFGDVNIIQMLLSNGADVDLKTWSKLSPLKIAVTFGHFDAAKLLVESGADQVDIINGYHMNISDVPEWT